MTKETLSKKIKESDLLNGTRWISGIATKDVKEKIQNAQKRLKGLLEEVGVNRHRETINKIDKIFKEEFGKELLK